MISIALQVLVLIACSADQNRPTDIQEYGFSGRVKSLFTTTYADLPMVDGEWKISEDKVIGKQKMIFNEEGNITETIEYYPVDGADWYVVTTKIEFEDGVRSSYTKTDMYGTIVETGKYTWIDSRHWELTAHRYNGTILTTFGTLNDRFRDLSGGYSFIVNDVITVSVSYENQLSPTGELISSLCTDEVQGTSYTMEFLQKEKDERGNLIQVASINKEAQTLMRIDVRTFEYYE